MSKVPPDTGASYCAEPSHSPGNATPSIIGSIIPDAGGVGMAGFVHKSCKYGGNSRFTAL